jgi:propionyl-CoA synthetase
MVPEGLFSMLATARLGAIHSVVFGGFSATELAHRIIDSKPTLIVCGSVGYEPK